MIVNRTLCCLLFVLNCVFADIDSENFHGSYLRDKPKELTCDNEALRHYCQSECGDTHACMFGRCFCQEDDNDARMPADTYPQRPALRHHIAHFCPNLEEARKCIRTCMKQGKPAFCGKDHVCYCGHKSSTPEDEEKMDVKEIYSQFRDLYQKYFGSPSYNYDSDHSHEDYH